MQGIGREVWEVGGGIINDKVISWKMIVRIVIKVNNNKDFKCCLKFYRLSK